jgi:hypothetical protein
MTIMRWMLTGRKNRMLGLLPEPGVSEQDITRSSEFGRIVAELLPGAIFPDIQDRLNRLDACKVAPHLMRREQGAPQSLPATKSKYAVLLGRPAMLPNPGFATR